MPHSFSASLFTRLYYPITTPYRFGPLIIYYCTLLQPHRSIKASSWALSHGLCGDYLLPPPPLVNAPGQWQEFYTHRHPAAKPKLPFLETPLSGIAPLSRSSSRCQSGTGGVPKKQLSAHWSPTQSNPPLPGMTRRSGQGCNAVPSGLLKCYPKSGIFTQCASQCTQGRGISYITSLRKVGS